MHEAIRDGWTKRGGLPMIYEKGCQEKQLSVGLRPGHWIVVEAASPIFRYARTFRRFKNGQCNTVTEFRN